METVACSITEHALPPRKRGYKNVCDIQFLFRMKIFGWIVELFILFDRLVLFFVELGVFSTANVLYPTSLPPRREVGYGCAN